MAFTIKLQTTVENRTYPVLPFGGDGHRESGRRAPPVASEGDEGRGQRGGGRSETKEEGLFWDTVRQSKERFDFVLRIL